ncbi:hypothetical protein Vretimale_6138 [Volvox reticuliferus]|uniref:Uncharacterized protein n=1 Tax=Volvox reticuliferus TaxID=1737510 RepID=A0A8J4G761_9CHLO|nr:hypothetical protein Vretimale_6138 [Volvox reticuliferus]
MNKQRKKKDAATAGISTVAHGVVARTATNPPTNNSRPAGASTSLGAPGSQKLAPDGASDLDKASSKASTRHSAGAPAAGSAPRTSPRSANLVYENASTGIRRRRRGGGGGGSGGDGAGSTAEARGGVTTGDRTAAGWTTQAQTLKGNSASTGTGTGTGNAGTNSDGGSGSGESCQRRHRVWRVMQWPLVFGLALLALAAVHQRLIEEAPLTELFQDGIVGPFARLNVTLPRPSLDTLVASTGVNVSALIGLTDALTDTLSDITDTIIAGRLSLAGLLPQLPAFNLLPPLGLGGGAGDAEATGLRPGLMMARRGYRAKHPVVIIPVAAAALDELLPSVAAVATKTAPRRTVQMPPGPPRPAAVWFL